MRARTLWMATASVAALLVGLTIGSRMTAGSGGATAGVQQDEAQRASAPTSADQPVVFVARGGAQVFVSMRRD